ncbi:MAG: hypothetical protein QFX33_00610 [Candidatus Nezhaarchaeota archaeon]|nr:hypothetical protein [Candidatus Nezhaarchaeota archaeon]
MDACGAKPRILYLAASEREAQLLKGGVAESLRFLKGTSSPAWASRLRQLNHS